MNRFAWLLTPLPCAVILCLANALKPAVIDDLAYLWYARQIVETPGEPFGPPPDGFSLIWYDRGQRAFTLLTPMVVPYWLAAGLRLIGENLVLLKLWLFPFCLALTASTWSLLKRFATGHEKLLLALVIFSPAFLPSINLMVDVPAAALSVAAVAVFASGLDAPATRWRRVLVAGLAAGLATQTKYTGLTAAPTLLLYAILRGRWWAGLGAAVIAAGVFVGWEGYLIHVYGRSHFLLQVEQRRVRPPAGGTPSVLNEVGATLRQKAELIVPLGGVLGGVAAALIPLAAVALRARVRLVRLALVVPILGFILMAAVPEPGAVFYRNPLRLRDEVSVSTIVVGINGVAVCSLLLAAAMYLGFRGWNRHRIRLRGDPQSWFLIGWLGIELGGYFALSPFAAARRVLGVYVAGTLLVGRLLSATARSCERRRLAGGACALGVSLGILFAGTDLFDGVAEKDTIEACAEWIRQQPGQSGTLWFCGHWGFQYYAERAGLKAVYPGESVLNEGDWLIYPDSLLRPYSQLIVLNAPWAEKVATLEWTDRWPLRTNPDFYDSYQPIRRHDGHRLRVYIFRIKKTFRARPV